MSFKRIFFLFSILFLIVFLGGLWYGVRKKGIFSEFIGYVFFPLWKSGSSLGREIKELYRDYIELVKVKEENERLKAEILKLKAELNVYKEREALYQELENFYKISTHFSYPKVGARVILKPMDPFSGVIFIDKGTQDGILPQMPVLSAVGDRGIALVGQVVEVYRSWSKVILFTDPSFAVDVVVQRTRDRGILKGKAEPLCSLEYLPLYSQVQPKDEVVTSGQDALFPPGLMVGEVVSVSRDENQGLFRKAEVKPWVDIHNLEIVYILIKVPEISF